MRSVRTPSDNSVASIHQHFGRLTLYIQTEGIIRRFSVEFQFGYPIWRGRGNRKIGKSDAERVLGYRPRVAIDFAIFHVFPVF